MNVIEAGVITMVTASGTTAITSGPAQLIGVTFCGSCTGQIQFYGSAFGTTALTPVITFCATTSAVIGGFSPMFLRIPAFVTGGFSVDLGSTADPKMILYWRPS